jgi:TetR/AcrR family transcriptional regulator
MMGKIKEVAAREKILTAARLLFSSQGFNGASVSVIAKEAGVNKALLFYYFNSKKNLYEEVIKDVFDSFLKAIPPINDEHGDPWEQLKEMLRAYIFHSAQTRDLSMMIVRELVAGRGPGLPLSLEHLEHVKSQVRRPLVDLLTQGMRRGTFKDIDPEFVATAILGILHIYYRLPQGPERPVDDEEVFQNTISLLEKGILSGRNDE